MYELDTAVLELLEQGKHSEFELLKSLQNEPYCVFDPNMFATELDMFQTHFILFNCLYRLQNDGLNSKRYCLFISALEISKQPFQQSSNSQITEDAAEAKIREYYLDWQNFEQTGADDVEQLLTSFWQKYLTNNAGNDVQKALEVLQLSELPTKEQLKIRFKKLSLLHHPDKNGDLATYQKIVVAYNFIKPKL